MKPRVFLAHSKADRTLIEKVANSLKVARIDVWYDEWEIPPGEPFRPKIFEEGIPGSDLFFAYLSSDSKDSYWVRQELNAAFIQDMDQKGGFIALFVDSDVTRNGLALDLRAINCPVLNNEEYQEPIMKLVARAWEASLKKREAELGQAHEAELNKLQLRNKELELELAMSQAEPSLTTDEVVAFLRERKIEHDLLKEDLTTLELLTTAANVLALGISKRNLDYWLGSYIGKSGKYPLGFPITSATPFKISDLYGPLILVGLVSVQPGSSAAEDRLFLSEFGRQVYLSTIDKPS